jgi:hypothetical protein
MHISAHSPKSTDTGIPGSTPILFAHRNVRAIIKKACFSYLVIRAETHSTGFCAAILFSATTHGAASVRSSIILKRQFSVKSPNTDSLRTEYD